MPRTFTVALIGLGAAVLCAGQTLPVSQGDTAARVRSLEGQVSVLRDSVPWALQVGDKVQARQVIVTGPDGSAVFELSDGSTFEVYPGSRVVFRNNPGNLRDVLDLWLGRVKVYIQRLGGSPNPNRVHTPTAVISVRGTVFDVSVEEEDTATLVVVEEGEVAVQHALLPRGDPKIVRAGEYLRIYKDAPIAYRRGIDKGSAIQHALRGLADALQTVVYRTPRTGSPLPGGTPGGGTGLPGDTGSTPPPDRVPPPGDPGTLPPPPPPPGL